MFSKTRQMTAIAVAATAVLSTASLTTCGTAAADGYIEWIDDIARLLSHDEVVPIDVARNEASMALGPAMRFAVDDRTQGERITEAACEYNEKIENGEPVYEVFLGLTKSELDATLEEAAELAKYPVKAVKVFCSNS